MKSSKTKAKRAGPPSKRPKLHPISEEMRQWSALLESELVTWPNVIPKPMFGFRSFYRGRTIFAAIPRSREFDPRGSIIMKFDPLTARLQKRLQSDPRCGSWSRIPGKGWFSFTVNSPSDLRDAIEWLGHAYQAAAASVRRKR